MLKKIGFSPEQIDKLKRLLRRHGVTIPEDGDDQLELWDNKTQRSIILDAEDLLGVYSPEELALAFDKGFEQPYDTEIEVKRFEELCPIIARCIRRI